MVNPAIHCSHPTARCRKPGLLLLILLSLLPILASAQTPRETHIELAASEDQIYVQQQLLITVRLFYSDNVVRGELSRPEHPDAVIEEAGEQRQYRERLNGTDYQVVERRYAVFPQSPGPFQLPTIEFNGLARHSRGHVYRLSDSATLFEILVRDIPADFSGDAWLPAQSLAIFAEGLDPGQTVRPGENLTRTLELRAEGLPASVLPPLKHSYPEALKSYPEPANRDASIGPDGIIAILEQTVALVPVPGHGGEVEVPAIRIPWWDVTEDREKVAVLPARTLMVAGDPVTSADDPPANTEAEQIPAETAKSRLPEELDSKNVHWGWYAILIAMALGWGATAVGWWLDARSRGDRVTRQKSNSPPNGEKVLFEHLQGATKTLDPAFFTLLPRWTAAATGRQSTTTGDALALLGSTELTLCVRQWQQHLYQGGHADAPDPGKLLRLLDDLRRQQRQPGAGTAQGSGSRLPDLYPAGIEPG